MLIDLKLNGKYIVMVGGGSECHRKILNFLNTGSKILVVSRAFSSNIKRLHETKKIDLQKTEIKDAAAFINGLKPKPDLLVAVTNDHKLNSELVKHAKSLGCMVYAADNPSISDFTLPAVTRVGGVRIAISTAGESPAMARVLRQRIMKMITEEDLLQIKLQSHIRALLKQRITDQKTRRKILYEMLKDKEIKTLLHEGKFEEAVEVALKILEASSIRNPAETAGQRIQEAR